MLAASRILKLWSFTMNTIQKNYSVSGMTCSGCAANVEKILIKQEGVGSAHVDLEKATVLLELAPESVRPTDLKKVLIEAGYDLLID
ncbi:MAG: heavy-metal-associated domain-containing protein [Leptospirales bacterium]|jgi:copper chaperone CopZ